MVTFFYTPSAIVVEVIFKEMSSRRYFPHPPGSASALNQTHLAYIWDRCTIFGTWQCALLAVLVQQQQVLRLVLTGQTLVTMSVYQARPWGGAGGAAVPGPESRWAPPQPRKHRYSAVSPVKVIRQMTSHADGGRGRLRPSLLRVQRGGVLGSTTDSGSQVATLHG